MITEFRMYTVVLTLNTTWIQLEYSKSSYLVYRKPNIYKSSEVISFKVILFNMFFKLKYDI